MSAEEQQNIVTEQPEAAEGAERTETTQPEEKRFSQDEVNKIIEKRLARQRERFSSILNADPEELEARERDITRRELKLAAFDELAQKGLPSSLFNILDYSSKEACEQSMAAVSEAFQRAVEEGVRERIKGGAPMRRAPQGDSLDEQIRQAFRPSMKVSE